MNFRNHQTGMLDWGIGGLTVYRELKRLDPLRSIVYFSDSGVTPYGKLSRPALEKRVSRVCEHFLERDIQELVIACNAASTVAPHLRRKYAACGLRVVDVISSGIRLAEGASWQRLGVIGGERTIRSQVYQRVLGRRGRVVVGRIAQPLSALIERGELDTPQMHETLA